MKLFCDRKISVSRALMPHVVRIVAFIFLSAIFVNAASTSPNPDDEIKRLIKQATKLARAGSLGDAESILRRAVLMDEKKSDAKVELAYVLSKQQRLTEAYDISLGVAKGEPKNARAFAVLGMTLLSAGRFDDARLILSNSVSLNRREDLGWFGLGLLDFYENNMSSSFARLKEAIFYDSKDPDYHFAVAQVAARAEQYTKAAEAYNEYLDLSGIGDVERRARIKGLIRFLRFLGVGEKLYRPAGKEHTVTQFELIGSRPIVTVRINGKDRPLRFVLDTGSGICVISEDTAKKFKIKPVTRGGFERGIGGDGKFEIVYGLLDEIEIGDVAVRNIPVYIRKFHHENQYFDGYIGLAFLSKFLTTIDYGTNTLSLVKRDEDRKEQMMDAEMSMPLRLTSSGFLSGEVKLQGISEPLNFIVDTGASVSVISKNVASSNEISRYLNDEKLRVIGSAGVTDGVSAFQLPRVSFGKHTRTDILAVALDLGIINEAAGFEQAGILGGNFLRNYRLTFDFKNSQVTFVPLKPESPMPN